MPGPFEWDLKRLATSVEIAARDRGFAPRGRTAAVLATVRSYRATMQDLAARRDLEVWYSQASADTLVEELRRENARSGLKEMRRLTTRAYASDTLHDLAKLTHDVDGEPRFISDPPLIVALADLAEREPGLEANLRAIYRRYRRTLQADRRHLANLNELDYARFRRAVDGGRLVAAKALSG